ncbi:MAG: hypothetical protein DGJ47_000305 [Rickettsiaceae bacterium]
MKESDKIQNRINKHKPQKHQKSANLNGNEAFNIAIEIVAGAIAGIAIGLFFDYLFDSSPISLIICMTLSFSATLRLIWTKNLKK